MIMMIVPGRRLAVPRLEFKRPERPARSDVQAFRRGPSVERLDEDFSAAGGCQRSRPPEAAALRAVLDSPLPPKHEASMRSTDDSAGRRRRGSCGAASTLKKTKARSWEKRASLKHSFIRSESRNGIQGLTPDEVTQQSKRSGYSFLSHLGDRRPPRLPVIRRNG